MKVKILKVTDTNGKDKEQRIWGDIRELSFLEIGAPMFLNYVNDFKFRKTSSVVGIQESMDDNFKAVHTENSIYHLEFLEEV